MFVWLNGALVGADEAHVAIDDHGLVVGDGAFETMKTVRGEAFALTRHLRRLHRSLTALSITPPATSLLEEAVRATIAAGADEFDEARVRLTVTGGPGPLGSGAPTGEPSVIVATTALSPVADPSIVTVEWTRNERGALAGLKTTSYAENVRALRVAHAAGASEAIFGNTQGHLCEGTGTNIFVVIDGQVITPPLSSGCLAGVTRELVIEIADVVEQDLPLSVLADADEVFLTSTTRDVQGLTRIDDRTLDVGPITAGLAEKFAALVEETTDP